MTKMEWILGILIGIGFVVFVALSGYQIITLNDMDYYTRPLSVVVFSAIGVVYWVWDRHRNRSEIFHFIGGFVAPVIAVYDLLILISQWLGYR